VLPRTNAVLAPYRRQEQNEEGTMKYFRIFTGPDGLSHFEDIDDGTAGTGVPDPKGVIPAEGVEFRRAPAGHVMDYHPAPRRQFVITLSGQAEIEASDGQVRRVGPGSIMLADDTTGKGHITRVVGDAERIYLFVTLPRG
jgi:hypothetical protein